MASLAEYRTDLTNLLNDPYGRFYSQSNIDLWINRARSQVAVEGQCVRALPPSSGSVATLTRTAGGSGYTTATASISAPDAQSAGTIQATASVSLSAGAVASITITNAGAGYVATPTVTISGNGTGATATATLTSFLATVADQEVYPFSTANTLIQANLPGYGQIIGVQTIAVSWGALKPVLDKTDWSSLQAYLRSHPIVQNYPRIWAQYGQGVSGSAYLYPVPSQVSQMDWDCYCKVQDLSVSQTVDAIPYPWTEAVQYYAAYLAFLNAQRKADSSAMKALYTDKMTENRGFVSPAMVPTFYPGYG